MAFGIGKVAYVFGGYNYSSGDVYLSDFYSYSPPSTFLPVIPYPLTTSLNSQTSVQCTWTDNSDNESGFKRVVLIEHAASGYAIGFLTKEFTVERGSGPEPLIAVYVPTNHLYLGDIVICRRETALFPEISVEEGIRIFLTGGMALPPSVRL